MDIKQALQTALDNEQKGHEVYKETAEKTSNPIVKKTFSYLTEQEMHHIEDIRKYVGQEKIELKGDKLEDTKKFFTMTVKEFKEKTELSDDDIMAHETALELEQSSYTFYKEQSESTNDKKLKSFFRFLMKQENTHYELYSKTIVFIQIVVFEYNPV